MRRATMIAVVGSVLLVAFAGVALADLITCTGGRCEGTQLPDEIYGTEVRDRIFALGGSDSFVEAMGGQDELNGNNGGDVLQGGNNGDTYNGGNGSDLLSDAYSFGELVPNSGPDVMNGGADGDYIEGGTRADILRGQDGDECSGPLTFNSMYGDEGNDELYGGNGEDCMEGEEGTDEHYGGDNNDGINAVNGDTAGTHDLVDCGAGFDSAVVSEPEDIVRGNCENVYDVSQLTVAGASGTSDEDQQQIREAFLVEHGLQ
jgi:Ca2+-binding RTX toxin-like protein